MTKKYWEKDADYIRYLEDGTSAAIFIVRDIVQNINTKGRWVDIVSLSTYTEGTDGMGFHWIVCETFPRKIQPVYTDNEDENRYITWSTARKDIAEQRSKGVKGQKFLVLCDLIHNLVKYKLVSIVKKYSDPSGGIHEVEQEIKKPETKMFPDEPEWSYKIKALKRLNDSQVEYIEANSDSILAKIESNGKASPEMFFRKEEANNNEQGNNKSKTRQAKRVNGRKKS